MLCLACCNIWLDQYGWKGTGRLLSIVSHFQVAKGVVNHWGVADVEGVSYLVITDEELGVYVDHEPAILLSELVVAAILQLLGLGGIHLIRWPGLPLACSTKYVASGKL